MSRIRRDAISFLAALLLAVSPAAAQGIRWQHDIEAAKAEARKSDRLVLVHVWADGCGPCQALESTVFNQPGVAGAIESQFVPVKLNANEYPATAQGFGITRVPTDVVLTPDGRVIGKFISPATPAAYVAETSQVVNQYRTQSGQVYQMAAANAPHPPALNPAYSDLQIGTPAPPPAMIAPLTSAAASAPPPTSAPTATTQNMFAPPAVGATPRQAANPYYQPNQPAATVPAQEPPAYPTQPPTTPASTTSRYESPMPNVPDASVAPVAPASQPTSAQAIPALTAAPSDSNTASVQAPPAKPAQQGTAITAAKPPTQQDLPAGAPPLGFEGYCPVSMRTQWKWVPGDTRFGAIHRGRTYVFAGPQEQQQFLANPDYYAPALSGIDPVLAIDHQQSVPGIREHSLDFDNQFFLFSSEATLEQFTANPQRYVAGVRQAMGMQPPQRR